MLRPSRRNLLRGGGALAATKLFAPPADATFVLGKAGGGGGGYIAEAVHLDGSTWLICNSLNATDSDSLSYSFFFLADPAGIHERLFWSIDPNNAYLSYSEILRANNNGRIQTTTFSANENEDFRVSSADPGDPPPPNYRDGNWHSALVSLTTSQSAGLKLAKIYVDRVDVTQIITDSSGPFTIASDGLPFWMFYDNGGSGYSFVGDFCNFWWAVGTSLLVDGDIPLATLNKFFTADNKPVDPVNWPTGAQIKFIGGANAFADNQGSGGVFAVTGTLTNASTSPSD